MDFTCIRGHHGNASPMGDFSGGDMKYARFFALALTFVQLFAESHFHR